MQLRVPKPTNVKKISVQRGPKYAGYIDTYLNTAYPGTIVSRYFEQFIRG